MQLTLGNCSPFSKMGREDLLHRRYDPYPIAIDDRIAEETVVDALSNAYAIP